MLELIKKKLPVDVTSDLAKADWERVTRVSVRSFLVLPIVQLRRNLIFLNKASPKQLHRKLEALFCDRRVKEPRCVKSYELVSFFQSVIDITLFSRSWELPYSC